MEYNITLVFILDIKNEIKIENYNSYFDDTEWDLRKNNEKNEQQNDNKIHNDGKIKRKYLIILNLLTTIIRKNY